MKKYLLLLLSVITYGQTYQNPTFGTITTKTAPATTTDPYVGSINASGVIGKVAPENIPVNVIPPTTHYTPTTPTLKGHFQGLDNAIGNIPLTTAGNTTRIWFTGDATTITAGTFYLTNAQNKGTVASVTQSVINDDNQKKYFTQDLIGQPFATNTLFPPGVYAGNLSASTTPNSAQQRFTVELYKCNNSGTPIASGIADAPVGSLGVTVILILDSGLLTLADGSVTNVPVSASLASQLTIAVGERIRYHVSAEKVGTVASNITETVYYGNSYNSFLDVPTPITSSGVSNVSTVTGASVTNSLDNLNIADQQIAGAGITYGHITDSAQTIAGVKTFSSSPIVPSPTGATDAVNKGYADGLVVGLLDDRGTYNASSNLFPTTGGSGVGGAILKGDIWYVGTAGTLGGKAVVIGDSFRALVDTPGQTAGNWALLSSNLSYVPANDANVLHKTGDESFTGVKSATNTGASLINGLNLVNNGTNSTGVISVTNGSSGRGLYANNSSTGDLIVANGLSSSTGLNYVGQNNNSNTFTVDKLGNGYFNGSIGIGTTASISLLDIIATGNAIAIKGKNVGDSSYISFFNSASSRRGLFGFGNPSSTLLSISNEETDGDIRISTLGTGKIILLATPVTSAGSYDITTRNTSTGAIEKIPSNTIATIASPTFTGDPKAPTATAGDNDTSIATTAFVQANARPYKIYTALLTQSGTSAPTATVLENTLGGTVVWTRIGTGNYSGTLSGVFTANKTFVQITPGSNTAGKLSWSYSTTSNFNLATADNSATSADNQLSSASIEVRVYN